MTRRKEPAQAKTARASISLRERARAAWQNYIKNELEWERQIARQSFVLVERLSAGCGDLYDVNLIVDDKQVRALVDGLIFISTYYETCETTPSSSTDRFFGVRLWWKCVRCQKIETSSIIYTDYDLGHQLDVFAPESSHHCRSRDIS